ncbi:hypothetical protein N0V82_000641 [Gnomoniopsis sp. IMI 355080]|nr:hypothetical protein N0V82_000641 [Gnomoniopsis sp. IMI 355080]
MPSAAYKAGPELRIELDNVGGPQLPCQPGDVMRGRIIRSVPGVSPRTTISIRLLGRAKTKIVVTRHNGQSSSRSVYRNRYNFFNTTQTRQFVHDGPLHITSGGGGEPLSWPFAIDVPLHPLPAAIKSEGNNPDACFLSLQPEDIASAPLPASFFASGRHMNTKFETYVEYHLEAELLDSGSHGKAVTAVLPIQIRARPSMTYPLSNFDMQRRVLQGQISTYHLVPGMENAELSLKQKTKQFMGSSKVPTFGFKIQVEWPAIIQLENPTPIPFTMRIVPDRGRTSEVLHDVAQTVVLNSLELVLKAHTSTLAPTHWSTKHAQDTLKHHISLPVVALGKATNPPIDNDPSTREGGESSTAAQRKPFGIVLPSRWETGKETALDIGTAMNLRLFSTHATAMGQLIGRTSQGGSIYPTFTTYCIRHSATLKWKAVMEIAGQTEKFEAEQALTIVAPSEANAPPTSATQPTEESEHLPSYGETASGAPSGSSGVAGTTVVEELPVYSK